MNQTKSDKFNILLTNDDGFNADGINALFDVFNTPQNQQKYNVVAVSPNSNRSGIGTALTLISPIEINKIKNNFYSLDANPVDCVITAMNGILQQFDDLQFLPDLVISGINNGSNFSQTIWSSGTVSAAVYASQVYQIPALAVSLAYDVDRFFAKEFNYEEQYESPNYQQAAQVILNIVENITLQKQNQNQNQKSNQNQKFIYGFHSIISKLRIHPESIKEIYIENSRNDKRTQELTQLANFANVAVNNSVNADFFQKLFANKNHQSVAAKIDNRIKMLHLDDILDTFDFSKQKILLLVLDGITDPRNLGACLRTADAAGVDAVIVPKDKSAGLSEVVIKTACGAADSVPLIAVTNLARTLKQLQEKNIWVIGTSDAAKVSLYEERWENNNANGYAWVLGSEGSGLRQLTQKNCDELVFIPMLGSVESLNVAVATGICLYESVRRNQQNSK